MPLTLRMISRRRFATVRKTRRQDERSRAIQLPASATRALGGEVERRREKVLRPRPSARPTSPRGVLKALSKSAASGAVRVEEVMIALDPRLADTSIAGRQTVVAQVGKILRQLASEGRVQQIRPANYDNGRRHPHRYTLAEGDDAS